MLFSTKKFSGRLIFRKLHKNGDGVGASKSGTSTKAKSSKLHYNVHKNKISFLLKLAPKLT